MTRFMMTLDDAVDLVLYAFQNAKPGDLFVQKAPACTIATLARAVSQALGAINPVEVIGTRHGEKLYETLLTREEKARALDLGGYYRVPTDNRDLNYEIYFSEGMPQIAKADDYTSHNTHRLELAEMMALLQKLPEIREAQRRRGLSVPENLLQVA